MNRLLPHNLIDSPRALFRAVPAERLVLAVTCAAEDSMRSGSPIPESLLKRLAWRPAEFVRFVRDWPQFRPAAFAAVQTAAQAIAILEREPTSWHQFAEILAENHEAAEQLIALIDEQGDLPGWPSRARLVAQLERSDPERFLRVDVPADGGDAVRAGVAGRNWSTAGWAFAWLARNHVDEDRPLSDDLVHALSRDEGYVYLSMRVLRDRALDPVVWRPLEAHVRSARWAYHCLRAGLLMERSAAARALVHTEPAWLVELFAELPDRGSRQEAHRLCLAAADGHELLPELSAWAALPICGLVVQEQRTDVG